jgi:transcriptional regulator with XRE-family HTH domain
MTGKELKSRLAKTGYSFADIAKMIGTTPQTLNQMFQSADVKTGYLEKIASALNLPVSALIEANGDVVAAIDHSTAIKGNANDEKFLALLAKKDEQMDRLITIIENMQR